MRERSWSWGDERSRRGEKESIRRCCRWGIARRGGWCRRWGVEMGCGGSRRGSARCGTGSRGVRRGSKRLRSGSRGEGGMGEEGPHSPSMDCTLCSEGSPDSSPPPATNSTSTGALPPPPIPPGPFLSLSLYFPCPFHPPISIPPFFYPNTPPFYTKILFSLPFQNSLNYVLSITKLIIKSFIHIYSYKIY